MKNLVASTQRNPRSHQHQLFRDHHLPKWYENEYFLEIK